MAGVGPQVSKGEKWRQAYSQRRFAVLLVILVVLLAAPPMLLGFGLPAAWFDGLAITDPGDGTTVLRGAVVDQAALHGLLQRLRDVGLDLLWLREVSGGAPTTEGHRPEPEGT